MPLEASLQRNTPGIEIRGWISALVAAGLAWVTLQLFPRAEIAVFARGAASLAALLTGAPVVAVDEGWLLATPVQPVVVSAACSAVGYYVTVVALLGWRWGRGPRAVWAAAGLALVAAFPLTLAVNALRVVVVMQAHRWVIPQFPEAYESLLHLGAGIAVFLPALIGLSLLLEFHGSPRRALR